MGNKEVLRPKLVFADEKGEIFDHPSLEMLGQEADFFFPVSEKDCVPLPEGTKLFTLPGRLPVGWDPREKKEVTLDQVEWEQGKSVPQAVSAFLPAGFTRTFLPATRSGEDRPFLPLWAYAAVGWLKDHFVITGVRVDPTDHWNAEHYDDRDLLPLVEKRLAGSSNRLLVHLKRCATEYHCLAAKNLFYRRWECPIPVSPVCNADCVGCISLQPEDNFEASHERIQFLPTAEEAAEIAIDHLETAEEAVVSFGQGCEGEPLLQANLIEQVIRRIRQATKRGVIHMNSNGSLPDQVQRLCEAGLNSLRVSLNSVQEDWYHRYYRPRGYSFNDVRRSIKTASDLNIFTCINYLVFPGVTDTAAEEARLMEFIQDTGLNMIQWKNLNIDPDLYISMIGKVSRREILGMRQTIEKIQRTFSKLDFGYFNRPTEVLEKFGKKPTFY